VSKIFALAVLLASLLLALAVGTARSASIGHDHFTSDPYADEWCGIEGTSVDRVVANFVEDFSRVSLNVKTLFTATESGKSMEIRQTGMRRQGEPVDNGDGTYSITFMNAGQSPGFKLVNGPVIVLDVGLIEGVVTFDSATGDFISFEIVKVAGLRPPGCDAIVAALT
jgi:hypothetical protein